MSTALKDLAWCTVPIPMDKTMFMVRRGDSLLGWSLNWVVDKYKGHTIFAVPHLYLSRDAALDVASFGLLKVFEDVVVVRRTGYSEDSPLPAQILHAGFQLFLTGSPEIRNFAALCRNPELRLPPLGVLLTKAADLLR